MLEITMDGPGKNALGSEMMRFILDRIERAGSEPLLLTGAGNTFSAGLHLREVASLDAERMEAFLLLLERMVTALYLHPGPTVAAVNGHAIAGGCVLTLCCDHRVLTRDPRAKIGLNEVALGLRFPPRTFAVVQSRIPRRDHAHVLLGAGLYDPTEALARGLVDETADDVQSVARARLSALAAHPRDAYAWTKRDLRGTPEQLCADKDQSRIIRDALPAWTSPALREKIAALLCPRAG